METAGQASATHERRWDVALAGALVVLCGVVYANSLNNPFLRDDRTALKVDKRSWDGNEWPRIFTDRYWFHLSDDTIYRPLTTLSFLLNRMPADAEPGKPAAPWVYRSVNIALHAVVCMALYFFAARLLGGRLGAFVAAVYFAVHAVHTEAVTAIVGRADLGVTLALLAVAWLLLFKRDGAPWSYPRWIALVVISGVALFVKESAFVVLPLVAFLVVWGAWARGREHAKAGRRIRVSRRDVAIMGSVAAVCFGALGARYAVMGQLSRPGKAIPLLDNPLGQAAPAERFVTAIGLFGRYMNKLAWPHPLSCDYSYNQIPVTTSLTDPHVLMGLAWLVGIVVAVAAVRRYGARADFEVAVWCVGWLVITYSLISNAVLPIGTIFAERLTYLPSVAWCLAVGALVGRLVQRHGRSVRIGLIAGCAILFVVNAGLAVRRNSDWRNRYVLWTHDVKVCPGSSRAWAALSKAMGDREEHAEALKAIRKALAIYDGYWQDHSWYGELLVATGDVEQATKEFLRACMLAPKRFRAPSAFRLGQCYMEQGQDVLAIRAFEEAVQADPKHGKALNNLAYLKATGDPPVRDLEEAQAHLDRALELFPESPILLDTAADVALAKGDRALAIRMLRRALKHVDPEQPFYAKCEKRLAELVGSKPSPTTATTSTRTRTQPKSGS